MGRRARRRSIAYLCLALVVLAALLPGLAFEYWTVPEPAWVLLPDLASQGTLTTRPSDDPIQRFARAPADGRAPPSSTPLV